jgi:hypothetical protein
VCAKKDCKRSVEELYRTFLDLQQQFRQLNKEGILKFYDDRAIVLYQGNFLRGKLNIGTRFIGSLLSGSVSVNPDFTSLCYSVLSDEAVQYGTMTVTSYQTGGSSSSEYLVSTVLKEHYDECSRKVSWKIIYQSFELKQ